jgi:hypothetical protein
MAQQGKQMRVGERKGFVFSFLPFSKLLFNGNMYEVDPNELF